MNTLKTSNLTPWQPGQSGNPSGRKPGSKNMSTIVKELLDQEAVSNILAQNNLTQHTHGASTTYAKAIVWAIINKAMQGNIRAALWLSEQQEQNIKREYVRAEPIIVSTISPRNTSTVE